MDSQRQRKFLQKAGWLASIEARYDEALEMLALERNGHPRAQDFDPSGHTGGVSPVEAAALDLSTRKGARTKPDTVAIGREINACLDRAWVELERAITLVDKHCRAQAPKFDPNDVRLEYCVLHWQLEIVNVTTERFRLDLCESCYRRKLATGEYPTPDDVVYKERHGRWPHLRIDPKKPYVPKPVGLEVGVHAGKQQLIDAMTDIVTTTEGAA